jgi:ATP-dependent DNA helicase RecQ
MSDKCCAYSTGNQHLRSKLSGMCTLGVGGNLLGDPANRVRGSRVGRECREEGSRRCDPRFISLPQAGMQCDDKVLCFGQRFVGFPIPDDEFPHFLWAMDVQKYTIPTAEAELLRTTLRTHWGFGELRPYQVAPVHDLWAGRDVCAVLPTGGGKSICFQLPALLRGGLCLVISPLLALMHDQVNGLKSKGIRAAALTSELDHGAASRMYDLAISGHLQFLYVAPERLPHPDFLERLPYLPIRTVAVDEAHCISQWGHDFRPAYRAIAALRDSIPDAVWGAFTATATPEVVQDILAQLGLHHAQVHRSPMRRPNLAYGVVRFGDPEATLLEAATQAAGTGLVYVGTRVDAEKWSVRLKSMGIRAESYHAGLPKSTKDTRLKAWLDGSVRVLACTSAFGMGIDKPDVRWVFHAHLPPDLESYVQEAGRAGRDGLPSRCILFPTELAQQRTERRLHERFPDLSLVRAVYQAAANQGDVAIGDLPDRPTPFDLHGWAHAHGVSFATAGAALEACARAGHLSVRATPQGRAGEVVLFIGASDLSSVAGEDRIARELLRTLLPHRQTPFALDPGQLAARLHVPETAIRDLLERFDRRGVLEWKPIPPGLRITWLRHRIPAASLPLPTSLAPARLQAVQAKWQDLLTYCSSSSCRSAALDRYFGEPAPTPCGVCDRCSHDPRAMRDWIRSNVPAAGIDAQVLIRKASPLQRDALVEELRALRDENALTTSGHTVYLS